MKPARIAKTDKSGIPYEIASCCAEDFSCLCEMYHTFHPKPASQGLPPEDPEICRNWIKKLLEIGENLLALRGKTVVGHAALIPDLQNKTGEFVIFVDQSHRNLGIGTELTRYTLNKCGQLGLESVWLMVNVSNFFAVRLYKKFGFQYCDDDKFERMMRRPLGFCHPTGIEKK